MSEVSKKGSDTVEFKNLIGFAGNLFPILVTTSLVSFPNFYFCAVVILS